MGEGVLSNAWKGYNCSLFAYGQTGSGKSYSMVGYGVNKGQLTRLIMDVYAIIKAMLFYFICSEFIWLMYCF